MTWPIVTVNQVNQLLGETNEVERTLLFIGSGTHHQTAQNALSRRDNTRVTTATPQ
ncbi:hypothetical protein [Escherichia coli]|uniref:hypothetical protein n=1 Tax=Escherichia coli TaxID=562 RepID=UPI0024DE2E14|nr:hypothetical protein [Escherichia coli]